MAAANSLSLGRFWRYCVSVTMLERTVFGLKRPAGPLLGQQVRGYALVYLVLFKVAPMAATFTIILEGMKDLAQTLSPGDKLERRSGKKDVIFHARCNWPIAF